MAAERTISLLETRCKFYSTFIELSNSIGQQKMHRS